MSILFPTNLSEQSSKTFEFALDLAKKLNETITIVHVYPVPMPYPSLDETRTADISEEMLNATAHAMEERLRHFKENLIATYSDHHPELVRVNSMLKMGFVGEEVARAASEVNASFIVIGVKHASGLKRIFGGSDVSAIIRKNETPVITVPENYHYKPIQKIAYATDLTFSDTNIINRLLELGNRFDAQIKCMHVHDSNLATENAIIDDFIVQYKSEANARKISFDLVDNINTLDGIDFYLKNNDIDLLAVLKQKKYWLEIFESSMTKKLVFHEEIPMLIFHE